MKSHRLNNLFRRYAEDLHRVRPKFVDAFGCPICLNAIQNPRPLADYVAEEHVIPEALGGRITTLTCRACNNTSGHALEAHLVQRVLVENLKRPMNTEVRIGESVHRGEIHFSADRSQPIELIVSGNRSDPHHVQEAQRLLRGRGHDINLTMHGGYNVLRATSALVRCAYLLMYRTFGYEYILDGSTELVRRQIANPLAETDLLAGACWRIESGPMHDTAVCISGGARDVRCFVVLIRLDRDPDHIGAVVLPPPGDDGADFYRRLRERKQLTTQDLRTVPLPNGFLPFHRLWEQVVSQDAPEA